MSAKAILLRDLATAAARHPSVEHAVAAALSAVLPDVIEGILRERYPGEAVSMYVSKKPASLRRERDDAIRADFNGRNAPALAKKYRVSVMTIWRAVKVAA